MRPLIEYFQRMDEGVAKELNKLDSLPNAREKILPLIKIMVRIQAKYPDHSSDILVYIHYGLRDPQTLPDYPEILKQVEALDKKRHIRWFKSPKSHTSYVEGMLVINPFQWLEDSLTYRIHFGGLLGVAHFLFEYIEKKLNLKFTFTSDNSATG